MKTNTGNALYYEHKNSDISSVANNSLLGSYWNEMESLSLGELGGSASIFFFQWNNPVTHSGQN